MLKYFLSLGSNIEPKIQYMQTALDKLSKYGTIIKKSDIYQTKAWGERNQPDFYNAMIEFDSDLQPKILLEKIKQIEKDTGRTQTYFWGPREIDIDIIFCQDQTLNETDLKIPHPEYTRRRFILEPIIEIDEDYSHTGSENTITEHLRKCEDQSSVYKLDISW